MPRDYFVCKTCKKKVYYSNGYVKRNGLQAVRLITVRRHYKKYHPRKFKTIIRKAVKTRKVSRKSTFL